MERSFTRATELGMAQMETETQDSREAPGKATSRPQALPQEASFLAGKADWECGWHCCVMSGRNESDVH